MDALPVPRKGRGSENTSPGVVADNGRGRGPGCGRSGTCTVEAHILDSGVREVGEGSCGVRQGLALCTVRRRGSAWDRSATTISDEQAEGLQREIWEVTGHSDDFELGRVASREQGGWMV